MSCVFTDVNSCIKNYSNINDKINMNLYNSTRNIKKTKLINGKNELEISLHDGIFLNNFYIEINNVSNFENTIKSEIENISIDCGNYVPYLENISGHELYAILLMNKDILNNIYDVYKKTNTIIINLYSLLFKHERIIINWYYHKFILSITINSNNSFFLQDTLYSNNDTEKKMLLTEYCLSAIGYNLNYINLLNNQSIDLSDYKYHFVKDFIIFSNNKNLKFSNNIKVDIIDSIETNNTYYYFKTNVNTVSQYTEYSDFLHNINIKNISGEDMIIMILSRDIYTISVNNMGCGIKFTRKINNKLIRNNIIYSNDKKYILDKKIDIDNTNTLINTKIYLYL